MPNRIKNKTAIKVVGIAESVNNKTYLNSLTAVCDASGSYYVINGQHVPANEVEALYPTTVSPKMIKGKNQNGKQIY